MSHDDAKRQSALNDTQRIEHVETDRCGFDRNSSISEDCYVCECGYVDRETPNPQPQADAADLVHRLRYAASYEAMSALRKLAREASDFIEAFARSESVKPDTAKVPEGWVLVPIEPTAAYMAVASKYAARVIAPATEIATTFWDMVVTPQPYPFDYEGAKTVAGNVAPSPSGVEESK